MFDVPAWQQLAVDQPDWFIALFALGADDGDPNPATEDDARTWTKAVFPALMMIHGHWLDQPFPPGAGVPWRAESKLNAPHAAARELPSFF